MNFDWCSFWLGGLVFWLLGWALDWLLGGGRKRIDPAITAQLADYDSEVKTLRGRLSDYDGLKARLVGSDNELVKLRGQVTELGDLRTRLSSSDTDLVAARAKLEKYAALDAQHQSATSEIQGLRSQVTQLGDAKAKADALALELKNAKAEAAKVTELQSQLEAAQRDVASAQAKIVPHNELEGLRAQASSANDLQTKLDGANKEIIDLRAKATNLANEQSRLASEVSTLRGAAEQHGDLESRFARANTELETLRGRLGDSDALRVQLSNTQNELAQLKAAPAPVDHTPELESLRHQLRVSKAAHDGLRARFDEHQNELQSLRNAPPVPSIDVGEFERLKNEHAQLQAQVADTSAMDALQQRHNELEGASRAAQEENNQLRGRLADTSALDAARHELENHKNTHNELQARHNALEEQHRNEMAALNQKHAELENAVRAAQEENRGLQARAADTSAHDALQARYNELEGKHQSETQHWQQRHNELEGASRAAQEENNALRGRLADTSALDAARHELENHKNAHNDLQARYAALETQHRDQSDAHQRDRAELEEAHNASQEELRSLRAKLGDQRDDFEPIHGIGPAFEKRLYAAGVTSYQKLASMTPEEINAIIKPQSWQHIDAALWATQAGQLARGEKIEAPESAPREPRNRTVRVDADEARAMRKRSQALENAEEEIRKLRERLGGGGTRRRAEGESEEAQGLRRRNEELEEFLGSTREEIRGIRGRTGQRRDDLEPIHGIGPVFEQRLYNAGITTYAQLAALTPEQVEGIIQPKAWQNIDAALWIKEAGELARGEKQIPEGQPPTRFAAIAQGDLEGLRRRNEELEEFLQSARAELRALREQQGDRRDDFEPINGIGPVFEQRLYAAGIVRYEQLAALSGEQIHEIIKPKAWQSIDAELWIKEAGEFARGEK